MGALLPLMVPSLGQWFGGASSAVLGDKPALSPVPAPRCHHREHLVLLPQRPWLLSSLFHMPTHRAGRKLCFSSLES